MTTMTPDLKKESSYGYAESSYGHAERTLFYSMPIKDRRLFIQLLLGIKFPMMNKYDTTCIDPYYRVYKQSYRDGVAKKSTFYNDVYLEVVKLKHPTDRIGKPYVALVMSIERILFLLYVMEDNKVVIPLMNVLKEFIEDKYKTMMKYTKTTGKNANNFLKHKSAGKVPYIPAKNTPPKASFVDSEDEASYWEGYMYSSGKKTTGSYMKGYVAPNDRKVCLTLFNPKNT